MEKIMTNKEIELYYKEYVKLDNNINDHVFSTDELEFNNLDELVDFYINVVNCEIKDYDLFTDEILETFFDEFQSEDLHTLKYKVINK